MPANYLQSFYPEQDILGLTRVDPSLHFFSRVSCLFDRDSIVLDVGCGRGVFDRDTVSYRRSLQIYKDRCSRVIGIDVDPVAIDNPYCDEVRLIEGNEWPLDSDSVDLCVGRFVLEHVANPNLFFSECRRVLRPGGFVAMITPNLASYFGVASSIVPNRAHAYVVSKVVRASSRDVGDVFPVYMRANTIWRQRRLLNRHGFCGAVYGLRAPPTYLSWSWFGTLVGTLYERVLPDCVQNVIVCFARKVG